jgi:hypothetical protein
MMRGNHDEGGSHGGSGVVIIGALNGTLSGTHTSAFLSSSWRMSSAISASKAVCLPIHSSFSLVTSAVSRPMAAAASSDLAASSFSFTAKDASSASRRPFSAARALEVESLAALTVAASRRVFSSRATRHRRQSSACDWKIWSSSRSSCGARSSVGRPLGDLGGGGGAKPRGIALWAGGAAGLWEASSHQIRSAAGLWEASSHQIRSARGFGRLRHTK